MSRRPGRSALVGRRRLGAPAATRTARAAPAAAPRGSRTPRRSGGPAAAGSPSGSARRRTSGRLMSRRARGAQRARQVRPQHRAQPEPAAQHEPVAVAQPDVGHHRMPHVQPVVADEAADDGPDPRVVERVGREPQRGRRAEGDPRVDDAGADVLDGMVDRSPVRLRAHRRRLLDAVGAVRRGVPDPVAQRIARMPVEPPVDHLRRDARHRRAHGDVRHAVGQGAPAGLDGDGLAGRAAGPGRTAAARAPGPSARARSRRARPGRRRRSAARGTRRASSRHGRPIHAWKRPSGS